MAKVTGPLMSLTARGTIAKTLTYAGWKGIDYARTRVIPANPRSVAQTETRDAFTFLFNVYKQMPTIWREPWIAAVIGQQMTAVNMFLSKNLPLSRVAADLSALVFSPGAGGGVPPAAATFTAGSGSITIAVTSPTPPNGWTLVSAQAAALRDQDPHDALIAPPVAGEDTSTPYSIVLSGLAASELYYAGAWLKWTTASGNTAYSTALAGSATPT